MILESKIITLLTYYRTLARDSRAKRRIFVYR